MDDAAGSTGRTALHAGLKALIDSTTFQSLVGKLQVSALTPLRNLTATAKTDFGDFNALKTLSPFAIKANAGQQTALNGVWSNVPGADFTAWNADTAARTIGSETTFSDFWYGDRATLLSAILKRNEVNASCRRHRGPAAFATGRR